MGREGAILGNHPSILTKFVRKEKVKTVSPATPSPTSSPLAMSHSLLEHTYKPGNPSVVQSHPPPRRRDRLTGWPAFPESDLLADSAIAVSSIRVPVLGAWELFMSDRILHRTEEDVWGHPESLVRTHVPVRER